MSAATLSLGRRVRAGVQPLSGLLAWMYLYLVLLLGAWLGVGMLATGWQPVVVTSGSMNPTLSVGDVILIDADAGRLAQRDVVTFRSVDAPDELITHRVYAVEADGYVTKGDANPTPDTDIVTEDRIEGVGRLVIPLVGLPVLWMMNGDGLALGAWGVVTLGAAGVAVVGARRIRGRRGSQLRESPIAGKAVRRVRTLIGAMIVSQYLIDSSRFEIDGLPLERWHLLVLSLAMLGGINAISVVAGRTGDNTHIGRVSVLELAGDTAMVIVLTTATGTSGIGWVLFALPIIEAAARFRLSGALIHWMALTGIALTTRIWVIERSSENATGLISELEGMLDQLSVLLLVIIPSAHLVEQLMSDILIQRRATEEAIERGRMLQHVAETSREVNRLGSELVSTMTGAVVDLGFSSADIVARVGDGAWTVLGASGEGPEPPQPGSAGSGLREAELELREVSVTADDPDPDDAAAIVATGAEMLVRVTLSEREGTVVALRAVLDDAASLRVGAFEALRLLCGQASVALQNERLVKELRDIHDEMEHQATHDSLTGLPNRASFLDRLQRALEEAHDPGRRHAVLFLDLNGFKPVNDELGHEAGDHLLIAVGQRLQAVAGNRAFVARLGGDEFTMLLDPITTPRIAEQAALAIQQALEAPFSIAGETVHVGTSIGVAFEDVGIGASELLRRADAAMYAAKAKRGEIPYRTYHPELDAADRRRARLTEAFTKALRSDELELHYQPVVDAKTGGIAGVEALLRWTDREHGPVNTASILELAETAGLVMELNRWILRRAARDTAAWVRRTGSDFFAAVNASPLELESPFLVHNLREALQAEGLPASSVVVELSERVVSDDTRLLGSVDELGRLGVHLALDDFGEGKTSLAHLRGLPISMLKLDRTLVQNAVRSRPDLVILESITALAHELGYLVVAEGIETEEQRTAVVDAGADLLQGYLLHRPMPAAALDTLIDRIGTLPRLALPLPIRDVRAAAQVVAS